jgi:deoxyribonuclease-1
MTQWQTIAPSRVIDLNCLGYSKASGRNRVSYKSEAEAEAAGYRKARNCL